MAYHDDEFNKLPEDRLKPPKLSRFRNPYPAPNFRAVNIKPWKLTRRQTKSLVWLATIYFLLIGMLFGSWGTAYAAMDSLPNDPLYSVKLIGEDLQLLLTFDTTAQISLLTTFANRRADEATILAWQGEPIPERVTALIDEYQEEIVALSASLDDESLAQDPASDGVYRQKRPRDRDNDGTGETNRNSGDQPDSAIVDQTTTMVDLEIPDPAISVTGTVEISGTMNMTRTRSGPSIGPGPDYGPGPNNGPSPVFSDPNYGPGPNNSPGNTGIPPQQPPSTNPLMGNGSSSQPTENKGKKP